jgi:hypothetical protein
VFEELNHMLTERLNRLTVSMVIDEGVGLGDIMRVIQ